MFDSFDLTFSSNPITIIFGILLLAAYTFFVYKFTIPQLSKPLKILLFTLRASAVILIFLLIFEPTFSFINYEEEVPLNLLFVDNSQSLAHKDSSDNTEIIKQVINDFSNSEIKSEVILFNSGIRKLGNTDTLDKIIFFNGATTDFESVINSLENDERKISSALIISDGKITNGNNPLFAAEKLGIPIHTIGIGDTTKYKDVVVESISYNSLLYQDSKTIFETMIVNNGFGGERVVVRLIKNNEIIDEKFTTLNENGINKLEFEFTPERAGQEIFTISVTKFDDEILTDNNSKSFRITVLDSKLNILFLSGSPSADFSFLKRTLLPNKDYHITEHVEISSSQPSQAELETKLDSAKILVLVNYPGKFTPQNNLLQVVSKIKDDKLPYLFILGNNIDYNKLRYFDEILSFTVQSNPRKRSEIQLNLENKFSPIFSIANDNPEIWNTLPPVNYSGAQYGIKMGAQIAATININGESSEIPFIITNSTGLSKNISILAANIWKWKLKSNSNTDFLFDLLIENSIKWLNTDSELKRFRIRTNKDIYSQGEPVIFQAEFYDESLQPVNDGTIELTIKNTNQLSKINLLPEGDGKYSAQIDNLVHGNYEFTVDAIQSNGQAETEEGSFLVEKTNIEFVDPTLDKNFLTRLAQISGGRYFDINNYPALIENLEKISSSQKEDKEITNSYNLWTIETFLIIIIVIFALEWIIRKRSGLL